MRTRPRPRHARTGSPRPRQAALPAKDDGTTVGTPLRRAARAAYTRPDRTVAFERRPPSRQTYWTQAARRALDAALEPGELAEVITAHSQYQYDPEVGLYRCACGGYLTSTWADHIAAAIRTHVLGHDSSGNALDQRSEQPPASTGDGAPDRSDHARARLSDPGGHRWHASPTRP